MKDLTEREEMKNKFKLCELVSKITYSNNSNDEVLKSIIQNTKNNEDLALIQSNKDLICSEDKYVGILKRKAKK